MPVVGLVVLVVFGLTLPFGFVGDDRLLFEKNPFLGPDSALVDLWTKDLWSASGARLASPYYRPFPMTLAWLDARLLGGGAATLRAVNLLAHAATAEVLGRLLARRLPASPGIARLLACAFALHPLTTEHVVWLSGRFDGLALLFVALGLLEAETRRSWVTTPLCVLGALLSKETGIVLPLALAAADWAEGRAFALRRWVGIGLAVGGALALRGAAHVGSSNLAERVDLVRLLGGLVELLFTYARLLVFPVGLDLYHPSHPLPLALTLPIVTLAATTFVWGLVRARRSGNRALAAGVVLVAVPLALASAVGPSQRVFGDRFAAFPLFGVVLALGATRLPALLSTGLRLRIGVALIFLLGLGTVDRALYFRSDETLRRAALRRNPDHFYWLTIDGLRALERGDLERARGAFERAEVLAPGFGKASAGLCATELARGHADAAELACRRSVSASPRNFSTWTNLASALLEQGKKEDALQAVGRALELRSDSVEALFLHATILDRLGRPEEALALARRVLEYAPNHGGAWLLVTQIPRRPKSPGPTSSP